jgi:hypothetical protein
MAELQRRQAEAAEAAETSHDRQGDPTDRKEE